MIKLKWVFGVFLIIISFTMNSEMYQKNIENYTCDFYYLDIDNAQISKDILDEINNAAKRYNSMVFAFEKRSVTPLSCKCELFADDNTYSFISEKYDVKKGKYNSFFSGTTNISHRYLQDILNRSGTCRFYFTADSKCMNRIYDYINRRVATSYVHKENNYGHKWIMICVWVIVFIFLLFLTWCGIQFDKKRKFIQLSLGKSRGAVCAEAILSDLSVFTFEFFAIFLVLKKFIYCQCNIKFICALFLAFLLANSMLNLTYLKYNYKEILYGANINSSLLSNCYLMKAITLILAIASISSNIPLMAKNYTKLGFYNEIGKFKNYDFVDIDVQSPNDDDQELLYEQMNKELFFKGYYSDSVKFSAETLEISKDKTEKPVLLLNDERFILNKNVSKMIDYNKDFTVFLPKNYESYDVTTDDCIDSISSFLGIDADKLDYVPMIYGKNCNVLYLDKNAEEKGTEMLSVEKNTIFVYCNIKPDNLKKAANIEYADPYAKIMYKSDYIDKFALSNNSKIQIYTEDAVKSLTAGKVYAQRILMVNTVISAFMLLFELMLIISIIKLEYIINAKILAIKKILGYGNFKRNKELFLLNLFATIIGVVTNTIIALMYKTMVWYIPSLVGVFLILIEFLIIIFRTFKTEECSISKILKGGSL